MSLSLRVSAALTCAALLAGCSGGASSTTGPLSSSSLAPLSVSQRQATLPASLAQPDATTQKIGIRLTGEKAHNNKIYGPVLGYFNGWVNKTMRSQIVVVNAGQNVVFKSIDTALPHTASFLGDASSSSAPWPVSFTGSATQSPAGTSIESTNFSTGTVSAGSKSLTYTTGVPGFYMFGCAFHYVTHTMRTIVVVQ